MEGVYELRAVARPAFPVSLNMDPVSSELCSPLVCLTL
jgi:hypothetical protein